MMTISLLATTDVHGYIDEGLGDLKGLKASLGADLLIDNGDFFIGSSLACLHQCRPTFYSQARLRSFEQSFHSVL